MVADALDLMDRAEDVGRGRGAKISRTDPSTSTQIGNFTQTLIIRIKLLAIVKRLFNSMGFRAFPGYLSIIRGRGRAYGATERREMGF